MNYAIAMNVIYAQKASREAKVEAECDMEHESEAVVYSFEKPSYKGIFGIFTRLFS